MWLRWFGFFLLLLLAVKAQDIEEEGIRCYDCNSFNPHCRNQVNQSSPTEGYAVFTHCPKTQRCFIRKDQDGVIVRGCADGWRFSLVDIEYLGCKEQSADWLGPQVWCFCDEDLCNQVPMAQLNRGEYMQMSESSEYLSVETDLEVEHELTGWKGMELMERKIADENAATKPSTGTPEKSTSHKPLTRKTAKTTTTTALPKITASQSTYTSQKTTNSSNKATKTREATTFRVTTPKQISNFTTRDFSQSTSNATSGKASTFKLTTKATTTPRPSSTAKGTLKSSPLKTTTSRSFSETSTATKSNATRQSTSKGRTEAMKNTTASTTPPKTPKTRVSTTTLPPTTTTSQTEKADLPWWLWHIVSPTAKSSTATTTSSPYTEVTRRRGGRRRSYVKPKLSLVRKRPRGDGFDRTDIDGPATTPSSRSERWTWSPSWWDKWWRPSTRRSRRPKRPTRKYPRRPLPTQGRGHYWWLAPVGPSRRAPPSNKYSSSAKPSPLTTKKLSPITKKPTFSRRQPSQTTRKQTTVRRNTPPTYPHHIMATSTPLPSRLYPQFPNWGRRLTNPRKSIYPVMTTRKPRPTTRVMARRRTMKLSSYATRHATETAKKTSTEAPPTTVKVTTRRRRPTTLARRRKYPQNRPKPEPQQKDGEGAEFFCWDCYSASTNCRDVVNSPYSYYVGRTPCPYTRKCFVRKDGGVIYRGCADGWTSSLIERGYNGCKVQYTWGRPVEWCFCDSPLCNGESLKHIKAMYSSHITDGDNNVMVKLPVGKVMERKTVYKPSMSNQLR